MNTEPEYCTTADLENLEVRFLLEGLNRLYGHDFRDYALPSLKRRIWHCVREHGLTSISGLQEKVLHDVECKEKVLLAFSINVTSMFRDPAFYLAFRQKVVPLLRTYPFVRIWHAGCSTGEEVYSMAILLQEEGVYDRCRIYATDRSEAAVRRAQAGVFPLASMGLNAANYARSGSRTSLESYYEAKGKSAVFDAELKRNVVFARHDLATEASFNEFNVILCRNVLIYFNNPLKDRVHKLLYESLCIFGFLGLGNREMIKFTPYEAGYQAVDEQERLYRRIK